MDGDSPSDFYSAWAVENDRNCDLDFQAYSLAIERRWEVSDPLEEECQRRREEAERDAPQYPGSIDGDPTALDNLREENALLKERVAKLEKSVDGARVNLYDAKIYLDMKVAPFCLLESFDKWFAENPEKTNG